MAPIIVIIFNRANLTIDKPRTNANLVLNMLMQVFIVLLSPHPLRSSEHIGPNSYLTMRIIVAF